MSHRWDNPSHPLTDLPPPSMTASPSSGSLSVPASVVGKLADSDSVLSGSATSAVLKLHNQKKAATSSRINRKDGELI